MIERLTVGPLGENAYVISDDRSCLLVDPGDEASRILSFLDARGLVPTMLVATHGHLDHTAAIPELLAKLRERGIEAPLAVHREDAAYFGESGEATNRELFQSIRALSFFKTYWRPIPSAGILLAEGDDLPCGRFRVMHTPGHSRGSICLYDESAGILISGDTLFRDGVGMTEGPDSDLEALRASLKRLAALPAATKVFPGHGGETTIGREAGSVDAI